MSALPRNEEGAGSSPPVTDAQGAAAQACAAAQSAGVPLHSMFASLSPPAYVLLNHVITLWQDDRWRDAAAAACLEGGASAILDLCCGTGDLAVAAALRARAAGVECRIEGLDFCRPFLDYARQRACTRGLDIGFTEGDAGALPFPDSSFDAVGLAFAFRNLTYRNPHSACYLAEILRVLKPGGRIVFVETSQPSSPAVQFFHHLYLRAAVPLAGALLAGRAVAYRYLAQSAQGFFTRDELARLLVDSGFVRPLARPLLLGAVALVTAEKPGARGDA